MFEIGKVASVTLNGVTLWVGDECVVAELSEKSIPLGGAVSTALLNAGVTEAAMIIDLDNGDDAGLTFDTIEALPEGECVYEFEGIIIRRMSVDGITCFLVTISCYFSCIWVPVADAEALVGKLVG